MQQFIINSIKGFGFYLTFLCLSQVSIAQKPQPSAVEFGVYVGSSTSEFKGDNVAAIYSVGFAPYTSVSVGLLIDIPIKSDVLISIQPGFKTIGGIVFMSQEDAGIPVQFTGSEEPQEVIFVDVLDIKVKYLYLPILMKVISDNKRWQFVGGIETAWAFDSKMRNLIQNETYDIGSEIRNVNLAALVGLGYRFKIKKTKFSIDLLYSQGMLNVSTAMPEGAMNVPRVKLVAAETRLTWYIFPGDKKTKS
jgi:hypothetical protein